MNNSWRLIVNYNISPRSKRCIIVRVKLFLSIMLPREGVYVVLLRPVTCVVVTVGEVRRWPILQCSTHRSVEGRLARSGL